MVQTWDYKTCHASAVHALNDFYACSLAFVCVWCYSFRCVVFCIIFIRFWIFCYYLDIVLQLIFCNCYVLRLILKNYALFKTETLYFTFFHIIGLTTITNFVLFVIGRISLCRSLNLTSAEL